MIEVQERILEIYKEIKKLCDDHGITCFAIGGTCIGAVRHQGFIPWDDDLDIAIPVEQFMEFKKAAEKELPSYLQIYSGDSVTRYTNLFIKIMDTRTTFIEEHEYQYKDTYKGVFVDVMPISGIPKPGIGRTMFYLKRKVYAALNVGRRMPEFHADSIVLRGMIKIVQIFQNKIPFNYFSKKWLQLIQHYPFADAEYTGYVWSKRVKKLTFPKEYFDEMTELKFETTTINCPKGWDQYLTAQFGDYMKLPPKEQQVRVHAGRIDLERSYEEYRNNPQLLSEKEER